MQNTSVTQHHGLIQSLRQKWLQITARPAFQSWVARMPIIRPFVHKEGQAIFDLVAGFVHSHILAALVESGVLEKLLNAPQTAERLALEVKIPLRRMEVLLQAAAALKLIGKQSDGTYTLRQRGAAILGVPGLTEMIRHHQLLYTDLRDPLALWRDDAPTELAAFWPYVFGQGGGSAEDAARYSQLMCDTQSLVIDDLLHLIRFPKSSHVLDIGGGSGFFAGQLQARYAPAQIGLFDLPMVIDAAKQARFAANFDELALHPGNFRQDPLPKGYDTHCLIRILFDHSDETVRNLLANSFAALPKGGRLIICEPMSGGARPDPITDTYFAIYTLAMQTGRVRSSAHIMQLCKDAGFSIKNKPQTLRPYVATALVLQKSAS